MPKQSRPNMVLKAFRFPPDTWAAVEAACEADGINPSDFVRAAVEAALASRTTDSPD